ncbi:hypothetical protein LU298_15945 [Komagataeibacter intermedius]|uniref:hypothetical protein n=1 Tax=Komagataeibacter intermedius TaxID=66229 RepID=UPI0005853DF0|nr:hypothetical protein [Komagataeibacter intermedius]MCF3637966.1 hypothetical protein [Komagataeibacter intermedius]
MNDVVGNAIPAWSSRGFEHHVARMDSTDRAAGPFMPHGGRRAGCMGYGLVYDAARFQIWQKERSCTLT